MFSMGVLGLDPSFDNSRASPRLTQLEAETRLSVHSPPARRLRICLLLMKPPVSLPRHEFSFLFFALVFDPSGRAAGSANIWAPEMVLFTASMCTPLDKQGNPVLPALSFLREALSDVLSLGYKCIGPSARPLGVSAKS